MELDPRTLEGYRRRLRYKVCYHVGGFCPDVEDLVQETMTRFLEALRDNKIRNPERMGAFLSGTCNHVIAEYRRQIWRDAAAELPAQNAAVAPEAASLEMSDEIAVALAQMSDRDCRLLRAFYRQEKDKDEICRAEGLHEGQLRVILFRAKERFRKIYQGMKQRAS